MKSVAINEFEWELLEGIPHLQFRLYMVLRWFMDRRTGVVGLVRSISQLGLAQELSVHQVRGRHSGMSGSPSRQEVRSALDGLIAARLIEPFGNGEKLVFLLPKSSRASARPKHEQPMSNHDEQPDEQPGKSQERQGFAQYEQPDEQQGVSGDEQPLIKVKGKPSVNPKGLQREGAQGAKRATRGARLSPEWILPEEWRSWAAENRADLDVDQVAEAFRDYWLAKAGPEAAKADWFAAWRNWCRREKRSSERGYQDRVARQMDSLFPKGSGRVIDIKEVRRG